MNGDIITAPRQSVGRNSCAIKFSATSLRERLETSVLSVSPTYAELFVPRCWLKIMKLWLVRMNVNLKLDKDERNKIFMGISLMN